MKNDSELGDSSGVGDVNVLLQGEIKSMKALLQDDFKVVSNSPTIVVIKIMPRTEDQDYEDVDIFVLLLIRFVKDYPHTCPKLMIILEQGLLKVEVDQLMSVLRNRVDLNVKEGREMIYDLVVDAQKFLSRCVPLKQSEDSERSAISTSRYLNDFEELRRLGKGGFGRVVLCKNKLDDRQYAIKRVPVNDNNGNLSTLLREVATLSRLQHQYIVRYYQAWVEAVDASSFNDASSSSSGSASGSTDRGSANATSFLYIQMEYCPRILKDLLTSSGDVDKKRAWHIFHQIVEGVAYIHGEGIIHRDLTPNNIFLDDQNNVKIGDFGLAKNLKLEEDNNLSESGVSVSSDIGTHFYSAPEMLQRLKINVKADIYSLGVVLFELLYPFSSEMERIIVLTKLKNEAELPSDWVAEFEEHALLLSRMMSSIPSDRPSAVELLEIALHHINNQEPTQKRQKLDHQILVFKVKKLSANAVLPTRGSSLAAGYDLSSAVEIKVPAKGQASVPTDLCIAVPEGTYARVAPRSELAWKNSIDVAVDVIEADYHGPVVVTLFNHSDIEFEVKPGDQIAQFFMEKNIIFESIEVDSLEDKRSEC